MTDMPDLRPVTLQVTPEQPKRVSVPDTPNFGIVPVIPPVRPLKATPKPASAAMPKPIARPVAEPTVPKISVPAKPPVDTVSPIVKPKPAVGFVVEPTIPKVSATTAPASPTKPPVATVRPIIRLEDMMPEPTAAPTKPVAETVVETERTAPKVVPEPPRPVFAVPEVEPEPHPVISPMAALGIEKRSVKPVIPGVGVTSIPAAPEPAKTAAPIQTPKPEPAEPVIPEPVETATPIQMPPATPKLVPATPIQTPEPGPVVPTSPEPAKTAAPIQTSKPEPVVPEPAKEPEDDKTTPRRERLWPWRVLSALLPIAGVPMAAFWSERRPERSRACLAGSLVGLSVLFVLFTAVTVLGVLGMAGYVTL